MKKKSDESISSLLIDGQIIASAKAIPNYFSNFFTSIAVKINKNIVKSICQVYASHSFSQSCQIWGQSHSKPFDMIQIAQNKALRIINFKQSIEPSEPLYQKLKINKLKNNIILNNCLFRFDKLINNLPDVFDQFFQPFKEQHDHSTRGSQQYLLNIQKQIHRCLVPIQ